MRPPDKTEEFDSYEKAITFAADQYAKSCRADVRQRGDRQHWIVEIYYNQDNSMNNEKQDRLVDANRLLELIFDDASRPSLRWLRDQQMRKRVPSVKIGRLVFFNPEAVRKALLK